MAKKDSEQCCKHGNEPFIAIPAAMGGIYLVIVVMFLIFAKEMIATVISVVWAFAVMAIVAMFFAYKAQVKKK
ncbi:hypothetical protein ACFL0W_02665 [Nanoarchaeota archaeon]